MARVTWNDIGQRTYETGLDRGVLFAGGPGVPWNGLVGVTENTSGGEVESQYFDGTKYLDIVANEDFQATIEAFAVPAEFQICQGNKQLAVGLFASGQPRTTFGFSWRTLIGNDLLGTDYGYKLHLAYNCTASPSGRANKSMQKDVDPMTQQWTVNTVPPSATTYKPTAHFIVDSTKVPLAKMTALENLVYGTSSTSPSLPTQAAVITLLS